MMSPDDEPSQQPANKSQNKNSLINEAFNLTSFTNFQPLTVLPPTANHFQPIHSRNASNASSTSAKEEVPKIPDAKQTVFGSSPFNNPSITTLGAASFFDQPAKPFNPLVPPPLTNVAFNPTEAKPAESFNQPASSFTPIKPPVNPFSQPPSMVLPPASVPPPLFSASSATKPAATASANPYSAKGALNKKVYDNIIPTMALPTSNTSPALFLSPQTNVDQQQQQQQQYQAAQATPSEMFTPLVKSASNASLTQTYNPPPLMSSQPIYNPPLSVPENTQQSISLDQRLTSSLSFNNDNSTSSYTNQSDQQQLQSQNQQNKTMWNWFTQNKLVNTFVEKAKYGVESIVTTVDPQMKDYIHPANRPFYIVSSISNQKILYTIRESFNNAGFSKVTISAMDAQNSTAFATQIVGIPCALQSAKEKLENTLFALNQTSDCVVLAYQDFLAELSTDCWFELAVIMLKDKTNNIDLTIYTEAIPVSSEDIAQLQQYTPSDFNLNWSGFAVRLPEKNFNFNASNSSHPSTRCFLNYETHDTALSQARLSHALNSLAILFKNKLLAKVKQ